MIHKMKRQIRYTVLVLLAVIIYPVGYQNFHILYHDHGHLKSHSVCEGILNSGSSDSFAHECWNDSKEIEENEFPYYQYNKVIDHCPVCEHEFAKFSHAGIYNIANIYDFFSTINDFLYHPPVLSLSGTHISLRAPPYLS
jgi:hypothetical protein